MRESIGLHVGDVGCGLGRSIWKLLANEHDLAADGAPTSRGKSSHRPPPETLFAAGARDRWHPRAIFVGSDADAAYGFGFDGESRFGDFFHKGALVNAPAAATYPGGSNVAHSLWYEKSALAPRTLEQVVVKELERSERPASFFITNDFGEGLGSGAASELIELLQLLAPKLTLLQWARIPSHLTTSRGFDTQKGTRKKRVHTRRRDFESASSPLESTPVEKLNALLHIAQSADRLHFSVPTDLEAMSDVIYNKLGIRRALPIHFHDLSASTFLSFTSIARAAAVGLGSEGEGEGEAMEQIVEQVVPARSMPYALAGITPLTPVDENISLNAFAPSFAENEAAAQRLKKLAATLPMGGEAEAKAEALASENLTTPPKRVPTTRELVWSLFEPSNLLLSVDPLRGRYGKACAIFRANAPVSRDHILKQTLQLEKHGVLSVAQQWLARSPRRIHAHFAPAQFAEPGLAVSASFFGSNSAFSRTLDGLAKECERVVQSRSFLHAFEPQCGPDDWRESIESIKLLSDKYKYLGKLVREKEERSRWRQHDVKFLWKKSH